MFVVVGFLVFFWWVSGWVGVRRASRGKEGGWLRQCQGGLFFNKALRGQRVLDLWPKSGPVSALLRSFMTHGAAPLSPRLSCRRPLPHSPRLWQQFALTSLWVLCCALKLFLIPPRRRFWQIQQFSGSPGVPEPFYQTHRRSIPEGRRWRREQAACQIWQNEISNCYLFNFQDN